MSEFSEESYYALSDIAESLSILRQPKTCWQTVIDGYSIDLPKWRVRYDGETNLLIEEVDISKSSYERWQVLEIHRLVDSHSQAVIVAAKLASERQALIKEGDSEDLTH